MLAARGCVQAVTDRGLLREVSDFLAQRVDEEIRRADEAGDKAALSFALGSRDLLAGVTRDIDARPWARTEVGNYLLRQARLHHGHPDFRSWWA
jgi:hypothetical protein